MKCTNKSEIMGLGGGWLGVAELSLVNAVSLHPLIKLSLVSYPDSVLRSGEVLLAKGAQGRYFPRFLCGDSR